MYLNYFQGSYINFIPHISYILALIFDAFIVRTSTICNFKQRILHACVCFLVIEFEDLFLKIVFAREFRENVTY